MALFSSGLSFSVAVVSSLLNIMDDLHGMYICLQLILLFQKVHGVIFE